MTSVWSKQSPILLRNYSSNKNWKSRNFKEFDKFDVRTWFVKEKQILLDNLKNVCALVFLVITRYNNITDRAET